MTANPWTELPVRAVALDIDGTLARSDHQVSHRSVLAVRRLAQLGVAPILVTGRTEQAALGLSDRIGLDSPVISCNGALVTEPTGRTRIVCSTLTETQVHRSLEFAREAGLDAVVWTPDHMLAERRSAGTDLLEDVNQERVLIGPIDQSRFSQTVKVMLSAPQETLDRIAPRVRQELPFMQRSMSRFFESSNPGATKKEALRLVLGRLGIPASLCLGLADGDTDADWLAEIGTAVAVSNAMESVQAIADVRIGHHDDDAVAEFLELGIRWLEGKPR